MRLSIVVVSLLATLFAPSSHAEALAPPGSAGTCLAAEVEALRAPDGVLPLHRIVFVNRCEGARSFFWCAEHPAAQIPAAVACRSQRGFGPETKHAIAHRKEFQWHLPAGARIRFQDCSSLQIPTADFDCAPPGAARR